MVEQAMASPARLRHPWLRIQRLLRDILGTRWDADGWARIKPEIGNALAERSRTERAGWFIGSLLKPAGERLRQ